MPLGVKHSSSPARLRQLLQGSEILVIPGVYDCLGAKLVEQLGFEVLATSGFGIAASTLGLPDYGFLTATEALYTVGRIAQYNQQFIQGDYCDIKTKAEACAITCCVSRNGASGFPWKATESKNPRRSAACIQITALPELKRSRPWFAEIDSTVLQQNIKRLDIAYKNFFDGKGFPKFKNRSNFTSFTFTVGVKVKSNKIYLPKLGWMRFHKSRDIPNGFTIKSVTVRKRQDGWYTSLRIEDKTVPDYVSKPLSEVKSVIGCDLGITKLVHISNGHQINNPKFATNKKTKRTLKIRQHRINRKVKGSKNRKKSAQLVGKLHKKISDRRQAYQWKVANQIVSLNADAIGLEDLNVAGMIKRCKVKVDKTTGRFLKKGEITSLFEQTG